MISQSWLGSREQQWEIASQWSSSEDVKTEAEEYLLLGAVTRQRLVKTEKTEKT
jgi:hypothetical protein